MYLVIVSALLDRDVEHGRTLVDVLGLQEPVLHAPTPISQIGDLPTASHKPTANLLDLGVLHHPGRDHADRLLADREGEQVALLGVVTPSVDHQVERAVLVAIEGQGPAVTVLRSIASLQRSLMRKAPAPWCYGNTSKECAVDDRKQ